LFARLGWCVGRGGVILCIVVVVVVVMIDIFVLFVLGEGFVGIGRACVLLGVMVGGFLLARGWLVGLLLGVVYF